MKVRKLSAQNAVKLLGEFYETDTPEAMENSFAWSHAPEVLRANERIYEYSDMVQVGTEPVAATATDSAFEKPIMGWRVVGFGILEMNLRDARDTESFLSCGVFPAHRRRGYWHKIMADLIERSKKLGADFCSRTVNKENEEHYNRSMREAFSDDSGWIYAGDHIWPAPGHGYFVWPFDEKDRIEGKKQAAAKGHA